MVKSVDQIVKSLDKLVKQLQICIGDCTNTMQLESYAMKQAHIRHEKAANGRERAARISDKIKELIK